ncbi:hypothetical protein PUR61_44895 [Streptomyces sp. BE20]|uniref:hypothetical protein n=1 Tax=Streptomyces sp. BE20 TaxID=3002525 RepID=UPI002E789F88|nr:hypothetical protein [Streptomyces sp. BE20]MEE1829255.1 hypothetical protein [Streptomyces sp. BE20]
MVTRVEHEPLRIEFTFPDGTAWAGHLEGSANPRLTEDLAHGIVQLTHPLGPWKSRGTAVVMTSQLRTTVALLAEAGFLGGVEDLRPVHMLPFWLATTGQRVASSRRLLQGCGDRVDASLRAHLEGTPVKPRPRDKPLEPYTEDQSRQIEAALRAVVKGHLALQREVLALSEQDPDPSDRGLNRRNYARLFAARGPLKVHDAATALGVSTVAFTYGRSKELLEVRDALFPPGRITVAAKLLFGVYSGVVPDGIRDLGLEDFTWTGDRSALMDYVKHRRGPESVTLPARAIRLFEAWLELSAPLRRLARADVASDLWLFADQHRSDGPEVLAISSLAAVRTAGNKARRALSAEIGLKDHQGLPVVLHSGRIRTTYHNRLARQGWTGRTRIDPNHTRDVEGSHYVSTTTPAQAEAIAAIIEDAQADVLRRARPAIVLTDEQAAEFAARQPEAFERLGLDDESLAALLSGEMDVFTAACANQYAGLHGPAGKPCPARPWVCLLCPLAVFAPSHAPNLLRLKAYFARQSRRMTVDQFIAVFGPYADRLTHDILSRFDPAVLAQASATVQDIDAELPLRPEETSE